MSRVCYPCSDYANRCRSQDGRRARLDSRPDTGGTRIGLLGTRRPRLDVPRSMAMAVITPERLRRIIAQHDIGFSVYAIYPYPEHCFIPSIHSDFVSYVHESLLCIHSLSDRSRLLAFGLPTLPIHIRSPRIDRIAPHV